MNDKSNKEAVENGVFVSPDGIQLIYKPLARTGKSKLILASLCSIYGVSENDFDRRGKHFFRTEK